MPKITFEQAQDELIRELHKNEQEVPARDGDLTISQDEQYRILMGHGIEYKTLGGLKIYVKPFTISKRRIFLEIFNKEKLKLKPGAQTDFMLEQYSKILCVEKKALEENLDEIDVLNIMNILIHNSHVGRGIFQKKTITASEIQRTITRKRISVTK